MHGHGDAGVGLVAVEGRADLLHRLVGPVHRRAEHRDDADGVLVHVVEQPVGGQVEDVALERDVARLDLPVVGELLPDHLDVAAHHDVGPVGGQPGRPAGGLPAALEREPAEHAALGAAGRGRAHAVGGVRRVPQVPEHAHAAGLDLRGLRVLVLVDHVLVERRRVEPVGLVVHPGGHEGGQVEPRVPVEHHLVQHDLVRRLRQHRLVRDPVPRHLHHARPGEPGHQGQVRLLRRFAALPHSHDLLPPMDDPSILGTRSRTRRRPSRMTSPRVVRGQVGVRPGRAPGGRTPPWRTARRRGRPPPRRPRAGRCGRRTPPRRPAGRSRARGRARGPTRPRVLAEMP